MKRPLPELKDEHRRADFPDRRYAFDDPRNVRWLILLFILCCIALFVVDAFAHRHGSFEESNIDFPYEHWMGFYGLYGLLACVGLVLVAKQLRGALMRDEDYYEQTEAEGEDGDDR